MDSVLGHGTCSSRNQDVVGHQRVHVFGNLQFSTLHCTSPAAFVFLVHADTFGHGIFEERSCGPGWGFRAT